VTVDSFGLNDVSKCIRHLKLSSHKISSKSKKRRKGEGILKLCLKMNSLDEHSRVKLIPVDECDPGYINASFISVSLIFARY